MNDSDNMSKRYFNISSTDNFGFLSSIDQIFGNVSKVLKITIDFRQKPSIFKFFWIFLTNSGWLRCFGKIFWIFSQKFWLSKDRNIFDSHERPGKSKRQKFLANAFPYFKVPPHRYVLGFELNKKKGLFFKIESAIRLFFFSYLHCLRKKLIKNL